MRKILIFSLAYYPRLVGGAEVAVKEITDRISTRDVEFDMVTLRLDSRLPKIEKIGNVTVHRIGWSLAKDISSGHLPWYLNLNKYAFPVLGLLKARYLEHRRHYDAIWSIMASYNAFAALFFKYTKSRIPFLLTLQEGDPTEYIESRVKPVWPLFKAIFRRADHIQTISTFLADWAKKIGTNAPVTVVPNAVDFSHFSTPIAGPKLSTLREKLGKKEGDTFLITTSRLVEKNGVSDIIKALQFLPTNVKLLVLGTGQLETELRSLAITLKLNSPEADKNISDRVHFLGFVPHRDMPSYLQISDIFIRPSLSEGLGISFLEAMASGIPVIATPVGGIPDFLIDGETGLFCEVHNPKSIAQKVEKLMKDGESRSYIVERARSMIAEKYEWKAVAKKMSDLFDLMISDRTKDGND